MPSLWGKGNWGQGLYSQSQTFDLVGDLAPTVAFWGDLDLLGSENLAGRLIPTIIFSADLTAGPAIPLFSGNLAPIVIMKASIISGPYWEPIGTCEPVDWEESELCHG